MSARTPTNVPASVRQRLFNLAKARGDLFQDVLMRFGTERLLHRLGTSPYRDAFVLKGAVLFTAWGGAPHRMTRDADLLGFGDPSAEELTAVFRDVAAMAIGTGDGLLFDSTSVRGTEIREDSPYGGIRVTLRGTLDRAVIPIRVDVGFGDTVVPEPEETELPVLLPFPPPRMKAYPREAVIAEKFEAMVKLGPANTRLKDFYDVWYLATRFTYESDRLRRAVVATFGRRGTAIPAAVPLGLTDQFAEPPGRQRQWKRYLEQAGVSSDQRPTLREVLSVIRPFLMGVAETARREGHA